MPRSIAISAFLRPVVIRLSSSRRHDLDIPVGAALDAIVPFRLADREKQRIVEPDFSRHLKIDALQIAWGDTHELISSGWHAQAIG